MDNPVIVSGIIMLMGTVTAGLIGGIFRLATSRNGRVSKGNGRLAVNPDETKAGDLAGSFWLHQFKEIHEVSLQQATKLDAFGNKLDALVTEMATANHLLKDILKVLMENRIR